MGTLQSGQREVQGGVGGGWTCLPEPGKPSSTYWKAGTWFRDLGREVACPTLTIGHAKLSKNIGGGRGTDGSPEVFLIISAHYIPLALHDIPSTLVYNEFGRYGNPTERSEGGTGGVGGRSLSCLQSHSEPSNTFPGGWKWYYQCPGVPFVPIHMRVYPTIYADDQQQHTGVEMLT